MSSATMTLRVELDGKGKHVVLVAVGGKDVMRETTDLNNDSLLSLLALQISQKYPGAPADKVKAELLELAKAPQPASELWPELEPIGQPDLPPFPVDALPPTLRDWVAGESEATQTPPDMAALLSLAVCAAVLAKRVIVQPWDGYTEPVNLYCAVILDPANRKSAVFADATAPLRMLEQQSIDAVRGDIAQEASERRRAEKQLSEAENTAAKATDPAKAGAAVTTADELARQLDAWTVPALPTLIVDDATSERLAVLLEQNGERIASMSAEGGVFDLMAGKYSKSGMADLEVYLKGHSGDAVRVQRMGRPPVQLDAPALTMGLAIQPEVIRGLAERSAFRGRGLLGRFLYAIPKSWIGKRKTRTQPVSEVVTLAYVGVVRNLSMIEADDDGNAYRLRLTFDAADRFDQFCQWIETELGTGELEFMRDWGGKLAGATLRIAGVMHCAQNSIDPVSIPIDVTTLGNAERVARWSIPHAAAALELLSATEGDEALDDAEYLLRWLRSFDPIPDSFDKRDAQRHGQRRFNRNPDRLLAALNMLEQCHYIRKTEGTQLGGRVTYAVSPRLIQESSKGVDNGDNRPKQRPIDPELSPLSTGSSKSEPKPSERVRVTI